MVSSVATEIGATLVQRLSDKAAAAGVSVLDLDNAAWATANGLSIMHIPIDQPMSQEHLADGIQVSVLHLVLPEEAASEASGIPAGSYSVHVTTWEAPAYIWPLEGEAQFKFVGLDGQGTFLRPVPLPATPMPVPPAGHAIKSIVSASASVTIGFGGKSVSGSIALFGRIVWRGHWNVSL